MRHVGPQDKKNNLHDKQRRMNLTIRVSYAIGEKRRYPSENTERQYLFAIILII